MNAAHNPALFRAVNEQIRGLDEPYTAAYDFICECERDCTCVMSMTAREYDAVRVDPTLFAVLPGHEHGDAQVVSACERYFAVRKADPPAE